jgi:hypothetical protein
MKGFEVYVDLGSFAMNNGGNNINAPVHCITMRELFIPAVHSAVTDSAEGSSLSDAR